MRVGCCILGDKNGARNAITRERGGMPTKTRLPPPAIVETTGHGVSSPSRGQHAASHAAGDAPRSLTASETMRLGATGAFD